MKIAAAFFLLVIAAAPAAPASASGLSLSKGIKLCEAEIAKLAPTPKNFVFDEDESRSSKTALWLVFNARFADGRPNKLFCKVDRATQATEITAKWPL